MQWREEVQTNGFSQSRLISGEQQAHTNRNIRTRRKRRPQPEGRYMLSVQGGNHGRRTTRRTSSLGARNAVGDLHEYL